MPLPDITKYPPTWEPNAIPTDKGWRHPETNELLVSLIGGCHPEAYESLEEEEVEELPEEQEETSAEEETVEEPAVEEQPKEKPKKGKKK
jgi:hypothetical protein